MVSATITHLTFKVWKQPQTICKQWIQLCSNKTLPIGTEIWTSYHFHISPIFLPIFFFQSLKNIKPILNLPIVWNQVVGRLDWPMGHSVQIPTLEEQISITRGGKDDAHSWTLTEKCAANTKMWEVGAGRIPSLGWPENSQYITNVHYVSPRV